MIEYYFLLALIFFIINGVAYNLAIKDVKIEIPFSTTMKIVTIYFFMSMFWFVQLFYLVKLIHEEFNKDGKSH